MSHTNAQLAHIWANQSAESGRTSNGNMSFRGPVLYSYSTPIARIVAGANGPVALVTTQSHSVTTNGKHKNAVGRALGYGLAELMPSFAVPSIGARGGRHNEGGNGRDGEPDHAHNLAHFIARYQAEVSRLKRSRDPVTVDYAVRNLAGCASAARDYAEAFGLDAPALAVAEDAEAVAAHVAGRFTPEQLAKRERARTTRAAARAAKLARDNAERREAWRAGEGRYAHGTGPIMLRLKDADTIETSHGAEFPVAHALRAFRLVAAVRSKGGTWERNGHAIHLGHFQIDRIEASGNVKAGCHYVEWDEIEAMARLLKERGYDVDLPDAASA